MKPIFTKCFKTHFLLQQLQVPPTIVVHGPSVSTQQVGPSGTVVRRRLDLLTENELATISATIGINYSALNQLHKILKICLVRNLSIAEKSFSIKPHRVQYILKHYYYRDWCIKNATGPEISYHRIKNHNFYPIIMKLGGNDQLMIR